MARDVSARLLRSLLAGGRERSPIGTPHIARDVRGRMRITRTRLVSCKSRGGAFAERPSISTPPDQSECECLSVNAGRCAFSLSRPARSQRESYTTSVVILCQTLSSCNVPSTGPLLQMPQFAATTHPFECGTYHPASICNNNPRSTNLSGTL